MIPETKTCMFLDLEATGLLDDDPDIIQVGAHHRLLHLSSTPQWEDIQSPATVSFEQFVNIEKDLASSYKYHKISRSTLDDAGQQ